MFWKGMKQEHWPEMGYVKQVPCIICQQTLFQKYSENVSFATRILAGEELYFSKKACNKSESNNSPFSIFQIDNGGEILFRKSRYFKAYQRAFALFEIFRSLAFYNFLNIVSCLPVSSPVCLSLLIFLNKYIPLRVIVIFTVINSVMLKLPEKVFAKHHSTPCLT